VLSFSSSICPYYDIFAVQSSSPFWIFHRPDQVIRQVDLLYLERILISLLGPRTYQRLSSERCSCSIQIATEEEWCCNFWLQTSPAKQRPNHHHSTYHVSRCSGGSISFTNNRSKIYSASYVIVKEQCTILPTSTSLLVFHRDGAHWQEG